MSKAGRQAILYDESGMLIRASDDGLSATSLKWSAVTEVVAYKRDVFAFDLICLAFDTSDGSLEINEEMPGWSQLVGRLPSLIPGMPKFSEWWERVAQPPFAPCVTTLFKRA